jgi:hypothetical protein
LGKNFLSHWRIWLIAAVIFTGIAIAVLHGPVFQDPAYHHFADQRRIFNIPNFWNVSSNLFFLLAAAAGIFTLRSHRCLGIIPVLLSAYRMFFIGSGLIALGSAYYHLCPNNATLVWDRFAMTIAFMAYMAVIFGEHVDPQWGRLLLWPLIIIGLFSVIIWEISGKGGPGDLRFYILIQYLPFILIPLIVVLFPSRLNKVYFIWGILIAYAISKAFELLDAPIYRVIHVSGHALKHLAAAGGVLLAVFAIKKRKPVL